MNYSRQQNIFNKDEWNKRNTPIHIIGVGATGSWVALFLAKMGIENITVWDFDVVEEHNLPNQLFGVQHVGKTKVDALHDIIHITTGINVKAKCEKVDNSTRLAGVVFVLTDTMKSRRNIYDGVKYKPLVDVIIESRMGSDEGYVYCVNNKDMDVKKKYENSFYSDAEAEVSACGISVSIVSTAVNIASMLVWRFINFANNDDDANLIAFSPKTGGVHIEKY